MRLGFVRNATLVVIVTALWLAGCSSRVHNPYLPGVEPPPLVPAAVRGGTFDYRRTWDLPESVVESETDDYWIRSLSLPSAGENGQVGNLVTARYYQGKAPGRRPLVIVLPIWGVHTYPPNSMTSFIKARSGGTVDVLQILGDNTLLDWDAMADAGSEAEFVAVVDRMSHRFVSTVLDIRRLVDWAELQRDIDSDRIALVGFSMGAIVGSLAVAQEPRLGAGVLVMGGADLHSAFAVCGTRMAHVRGQITKRFGWGSRTFESKIKGPLSRVNPARYPTKVDPRRLLIIEAGHDTCLGPRGRERLWRAMGNPERITYLYDHNMAFLAMTFLGGNSIQKQIYGFLDKTLPIVPPDTRYEADRAFEDAVNARSY